VVAFVCDVLYSIVVVVLLYHETWERGVMSSEIHRSLEIDVGFLLVNLLCFSSNLKMEAMCSSETSNRLQRTAHRCISEDTTLYIHLCENLKIALSH
jgi:hypothetical protein